MTPSPLAPVQFPAPTGVRPPQHRISLGFYAPLPLIWPISPYGCFGDEVRPLTTGLVARIRNRGAFGTVAPSCCTIHRSRQMYVPRIGKPLRVCACPGGARCEIADPPQTTSRRRCGSLISAPRVLGSAHGSSHTGGHTRIEARRIHDARAPTRCT